VTAASAPLSDSGLQSYLATGVAAGSAPLTIQVQGTLSDAQGNVYSSTQGARVTFISPLNPGNGAPVSSTGSYSASLLADQNFTADTPVLTTGAQQDLDFYGLPVGTLDASQTYNLVMPTAQLNMSCPAFSGQGFAAISVTATIRMEDGPFRQIEVTGGHLDGTGNERDLVIVVHRPPGNFPGRAVNDRREKYPAFPCIDVDYIPDHFLTRPAGGEVAVHKVRDRPGAAVLLGQRMPPGLRLARLQSQLTHDLADTLIADGLAAWQTGDQAACLCIARIRRIIRFCRQAGIGQLHGGGETAERNDMTTFTRLAFMSPTRPNHSPAGYGSKWPPTSPGSKPAPASTQNRTCAATYLGAPGAEGAQEILRTSTGCEPHDSSPTW
jgi:hypothetical protein